MQHFARIILVVVIVPFMFLVWTGATVGSASGASLEAPDWGAADLAWTFVIAAIGILIGWLTASLVREEHVALIVGIVALAFAADFWTGQKREGAPGRSIPKGGFWGMVAGFTSFVAHAGGPPFQVYMLPQRLDKTLYVGTSVVFFWAVNLIKVPPYLALGQFDTTNLTTALVLMPLAPIGIMLGVRLHHVIPEEPFYRLCYAGVTLVGIKLVYDAASGMIAG